jgi:hypothetical protein
MIQLGPADLDIIELFENGGLAGRVAIPDSFWQDDAAGPAGVIELADSQNTPLAVFRPDVPRGLIGRLDLLDRKSVV